MAITSIYNLVNELVNYTCNANINVGSISNLYLSIEMLLYSGLDNIKCCLFPLHRRILIS